MDNPDQTTPVTEENSIHFWAKIEAKNSTTTEELSNSHASNEKLSPRYFAQILLLGLAIYVGLAIGFVALCLSCNNPRLHNQEFAPQPHYFSAPKYLTSIEIR